MLRMTALTCLLIAAIGCGLQDPPAEVEAESTPTDVAANSPSEPAVAAADEPDVVAPPAPAPPVPNTTPEVRDPLASNTAQPPAAAPADSAPAPTEPGTPAAEPQPFEPWMHKLTARPGDEEPPYAYEIAVSPDGRRLAVGCVRRGKATEGFILVLDASTGKQMQELKGHSYGVATVGFSPEGDRVISGSWDATVREFEIETGEELRSMKGHAWPVLTLEISSDGSRAVSASDGLRFWNLETGNVLRRFEKLDRNNPIWSISLLPNGRAAVGGGGNGQLALWNLESDDAPRILASDLGRLKSVDVSPDGNHVVAAAADRPEITVVEISTGKQVRRWKAHQNGVSAVAYSPDGGHILSAGGLLQDGTRDFVASAPDKDIRLWDANTGKEVRHVGDHDLYVTSVAFSPDGTRVYSTSGDSTVRAWNLDPSR